MATTSCRLDHLVIIAASLEQGAAWCEEKLGVAPGPGGQHGRMGTHNRLLSLGPECYLEVIAIDPAGARPDMPRWFGMDSPEGRQAMAEGPRLATFVANTNDIADCAARVPALGKVHSMQRGALEWLITIPGHGGLNMEGALPAIIQWPRDVHPSSTLPDSGCRLARFEVFHPAADSVGRAWRMLNLSDDKMTLHEAAGGPRFEASIITPSGLKKLGMDA
ncbi:VOC family protein [Noviherbaspirillum galbum]|uniref:VOC family protein n=1 Tax=Noviherbaspirillum galbum TaxID=2709383 RepID=A0A6B3SN02_9BURK|nr:VOC family protein [Noviherbaspirillum galbum]NEX61818.1 VOC family protein [Noviherbaspirillum galbum]